jgi:AcrR family transcriptional regulator
MLPVSRLKSNQSAGSTRTGRQRAPTAATDGKRERVMAVAARLFFEQGYATTTIDQIAAELGVTKPFVYYYFRDKRTLLEAVCWGPTLEATASMDFDADDARPAHRKLTEGIGRLVATTMAHHPAGTLPYRELQAFSPRYRRAHRQRFDHFYARMTALLEQARAEGRADCEDPKVTALAVASIPGFLYTWYRPEGRLSREVLGEQLTRIAVRALGLRRRAP